VLIFLILIYGFLLVDQKIKPAFIAIAEVNPSVSFLQPITLLYVGSKIHDWGIEPMMINLD
jgi:hypothetical protein